MDAAHDPQRLVRFVEGTASLAHAPRAAPEETRCLVAFSLCDELFALPVTTVREVVRVVHLTRIPQAPEHVRGVQGLRGLVLPVLEVRTRLGLPPLDPTPASRIIVVEAWNRLVGLLVDSVQRVVRLPVSLIQPPPRDIVSRLSGHVAAVADTGWGMALVLDVDQLLVLSQNPESP
jgi:purine-binding chemotaxis protein CheW